MSARQSLEPLYARLLHYLTLGRGVKWHVDRTTTLRIDPRCRWIRNPAFEREVVEYLRARVRPGDCCIDAGAHVGYFALQMALWNAPNGPVVAFEPNPPLRDVLAANVRLSSMGDRITVESYGLGGDVEAPTLDDYCTQYGLIPQWVRVNVAGLEVEILDGASGLLVDRRVGFVVEMHPDLWVGGRQATAVRLEGLLRTCGRSVIPLTGQRNVLEDYGTIAIP